MSMLQLNLPESALLPRPQHWQLATWEEYLTLRDNAAILRSRVFYYEGRLWFEMGEGINHAKFNNLFTMMIAFWKQCHPEQTITSLGGCQLEKPGEKACIPDVVIYLGDRAPDWESGQRRFINLNEARSPDLVGEISDTTLADDLDEKKRLYASLGIPEYWVIDVKGERVFAFGLQETGVYHAIAESTVLSGLPISLLEEAIARLSKETNTDAALWFSQQITP